MDVLCLVSLTNFVGIQLKEFKFEFLSFEATRSTATAKAKRSMLQSVTRQFIYITHTLSIYDQESVKCWCCRRFRN